MNEEPKIEIFKRITLQEGDDEVLPDEITIRITHLGKQYIIKQSREELEQEAREFEECVKNPPPDALPLSAFIGELEEIAERAAKPGEMTPSSGGSNETDLS